MEIKWYVPRELETQGTGIALIERIVEGKLEEYLANRFQFVEVKEDDSTRHKPVL